MISTLILVQALQVAGAPDAIASSLSTAPTRVWEWAKTPNLHEVGKAFPQDFPSNLESFGSITCVLGKDRKPKSCRPSGGGDPKLTQTLLSLSDKFQGPPSAISAGSAIEIDYNFRQPSNIVMEPRFARSPEDVPGLQSQWASEPTFDSIAKAMPAKLSGAFVGGVECRVGDRGKLEGCHIYSNPKAPRPRCFNPGVSGDICTPEQLASFKPAPELVQLASAVRAPDVAPDGGPAKGWSVRFLVSITKPLGPPMMIAPLPPNKPLPHSGG